MNTADVELLTAFELHSPDRIQAVLDDGFDVRSMSERKPPVNLLIEMYFQVRPLSTLSDYSWIGAQSSRIRSLLRFCWTTQKLFLSPSRKTQAF